MTTKRFHLGDVLSITTECLVTNRHMDAIYDILNFMTGDNLFTHQLPRAARECKPALLAQFPELAGIIFDLKEPTKESVAAWLAAQVAIHGEYRDVEALTSGHVRIHPLEELRGQRGGDDGIIIVEVPK